MIRPFSFEASNNELEDLRARLANARPPVPSSGEGWELGIPAAYLERIIAYWRDEFDWRSVERELASLPQFVADIGEHQIHFIHVKGHGPDAYPLILTHGWPSSFLEFLPLIPLLTRGDETSDGPQVAFDVVIPSLPGYGFSLGPLGSYTEVGDLWVELMSELGYDRFGAHGGDIGAGITSRMGLYHPERVEAIHALSAPKYVPPAGEISPEEEEFVKYVEWWQDHEGAYWHQQRTKPLTLGAALNDSPAGLAAWILEKWHVWSEVSRDVEEALGLDFLLANVTLYWLTSTITPSMEMYWHNRNQARAPWPDGRRVEVPARLFLTTEPVDLIPKSAAERVYADLSYGRAPVGGHFLAAEEPALLAGDLRRFFGEVAGRRS